MTKVENLLNIAVLLVLQAALLYFVFHLTLLQSILGGWVIAIIINSLHNIEALMQDNHARE